MVNSLPIRIRSLAANVLKNGNSKFKNLNLLIFVDKVEGTMKIIHTADWHIGKKLHNYDLQEDFECFLQWLLRVIKAEKVEVLLISGDIFDLANPSSSSRTQYYESLVALKKVVKKIILTGGNHDSPAMLNAPKELLKAFDLNVIGGLPKDYKEVLFPLKNKQGTIELVVAALPFLRNSDLQYPSVIKTYEQRLEALRNGIERVFKKTEEFCRELYPGIPALAMGHLYAAGSESSDSERDIQIGNQAAVRAASFGTYFNYVALGHIHKPQRVSGAIPVFYSGSPIPLSFSEREDKKRVLLIDTEKGWEPYSMVVPAFRKLIKITGDLGNIATKLADLPEHKGLTNLIEIELKEEIYQAKYLHELEVLIDNFVKPGYQIVKHRATFANQRRQTGAIFNETVSLEELKPESVFNQLIAQEDFSSAEQQEVHLAFHELMEELKNKAGA